MDLLEAARRARDNAYAPYSGFKVGAAVRCPDGSRLRRLQRRERRLPQGTCAEAGAIAAMVAAGRTRIAEVLVVADGPEIISPLRRLPPEARRVRRPRDAGDPRRARRRARPHHRRRAAARRVPAGSPGGRHDERSQNRRGAGARLPRPHQPRRRLRRGRDHRALPPGAHAARPGGRGLHLAGLRRAGEGRARQHPRPRRHRGQLPRRRGAIWRTPAPRPARRSPTAPTRSTSWCPGGRSPRAAPRRSPASVREIKEICGTATLKAILETGELKDPALIRRAADEALAGGADFLKTSTGKVAGQRHPRGRRDPARRRSAPAAATSG